MRPVSTIDLILHIGAGPWSKDHFPDDPLVPGSVLLDEISNALRAADARLGALTNIVQARFMRPVVAPASLQVRAQHKADRVDFTAIDQATGTAAVRGSFCFAVAVDVEGV